MEQWSVATEEARWRVAVLDELRCIRKMLENTKEISPVSAAEPKGLEGTPTKERAQKRRVRVKNGVDEHGAESEDSSLRRVRR